MFTLGMFDSISFDLLPSIRNSSLLATTYCNYFQSRYSYRMENKHFNRWVAKRGASKAAAELNTQMTPNVYRQLVERWVKTGVPSEHVLELEAATGLSRHKLDPAVFKSKPDIEYIKKQYALLVGEA